MFRALILGLSLAIVGSSSQAEGVDIRKVSWWKPSPQACNVLPAGAPSNGAAPNSHVFYLPPDVPDPVCIGQVMIDAEQEVPADAVSTYGPWFAALDRGSTYLNCSHWPGAQDCPTIPTGPGGNQFGSLINLGMMSPVPGKATDTVVNHIHPICYRRGDAILIGAPCITADGSTSKVVNPAMSFGLIFPRYTPTTACDTHTKLLLHGGSFPDPETGVPLASFISDSSPSWHAMASIPLGGSASNVLIDGSTSVLGQPTSIKFDGTANTMIWTNASGDFRLGAGDWTIDLWWRPDSVAAGVFQQIMALDGYSAISLGQFGDKLRFSSSSNGTSWNAVTTTDWGAVSIGTWTHVVVQRAGSTVTMSQDGVLKQSAAVSSSLYDAPRIPLRIGNNSGGQYPATGNMQEIRLSKVARWPGGNYTVPDKPYACP